MNKKRLITRIPLVLSSLALFSCDLGTGGGGGETKETMSYLIYKSESDIGKELSAVDPEDPGTVITFDTQITEKSIQPFLNAEFDGDKYKDIHYSDVAYIKNGRIYRAILEKDGSPPTPIPISNEEQANNICGSSAYTDFLNYNLSPYVYQLAGDDGICDTDDDEWKMVQLGMSDQDSPKEFGKKPPVMPLYDRDNGNIVGWLTLDKDRDNLYYCDENLENCEKVDEVNSIKDVKTIKHLGSFKYEEPCETSDKCNSDVFNKELLQINDEAFLFVYDTSDTDNAFAMKVYEFKFLDKIKNDDGDTIGYEESFSKFEDNTVYFTDMGRILSLTVKEIEKFTKNPQDYFKIVVDHGDIPIRQIFLTKDRVVYLAEDTEGNDYINSIKKNGDDGFVLIPADPRFNRELSIQTVSYDENRVYYNVNEPDRDRTNAGYIKANDAKKSTLKEIEYARWSGGTFPTKLDAFSQPSWDRIILIELCKPDQTCANNGAISTLSVDSHGDEKTLGVVPTDIADHEDLDGFGSKQLGTGFKKNGKGDIFYMDIDEKNSLKRITSTSDISEEAIRTMNLPLISK